MRYTHRFLIQASLETVVDFHRSASSLESITPPFFFMRDLEAPDPLEEGSPLSFTLWLGPLPVYWHARIENSNPSGFDDVMVSGPFERWVHTHSFEADSPSSCWVLDQVEFRLRRHPYWYPLGLMMALGLPILFAYRGWKTKSLLERSIA